MCIRDRYQRRVRGGGNGMSDQADTERCTNWVNSVLSSKGYPTISDITTDFRSGVNLANLCNSLDSRCRLKARESRISMVQKDNIIRCHEAIEGQLRVKLKGISVNNIFAGDLQYILAMLIKMMQDLDPDALDDPALASSSTAQAVKQNTSDDKQLSDSAAAAKARQEAEAAKQKEQKEEEQQAELQRQKEALAQQKDAEAAAATAAAAAEATKQAAAEQEAEAQRIKEERAEQEAARHERERENAAAKKAALEKERQEQLQQDLKRVQAEEEARRVAEAEVAAKERLEQERHNQQVEEARRRKSEMMNELLEIDRRQNASINADRERRRLEREARKQKSLQDAEDQKKRDIQAKRDAERAEQEAANAAAADKQAREREENFRRLQGNVASGDIQNAKPAGPRRIQTTTTARTRLPQDNSPIPSPAGNGQSSPAEAQSLYLQYCSFTLENFGYQPSTEEFQGLAKFINMSTQLQSSGPPQDLSDAQKVGSLQHFREIRNQMKALFDKMDANKDDTLSAEESTSILGTAMSERMIESVLSLSDNSGKGAISSTDWRDYFVRCAQCAACLLYTSPSPRDS
eukprot:TRINITY_DN36185_c0_g1_i2.p1 TRINITY_DN36185_c0_g1~~TRINITY_DN36185_c0_g1_i2.p1  ORF type:complete len:578 (+),score=174.31 TRINITY_DN36185_c0_g1_i2:188-1921(+)